MGKRNPENKGYKGKKSEQKLSEEYSTKNTKIKNNWLLEKIKELLKDNSTENGIIVKPLKEAFTTKLSERGDSRKNTERNPEAKQSKAQERNIEENSTEKNETEMSAIQEKVRIALRERNQLECNILALTGGKDGLLSTWNRIILCAKDGDVREFCFYAVTYPLRVKRMEIEFDNLMKHMKRNEKYRQYENKEPLVKSLLIPYENEEECRRLIETSEELSKRGLLNSEGIREEMLREFYEWSKRFDEKAE